MFRSIRPTRPTHDAYAVEIDPGGPLFKLRTAITGALSASGRPQTHPAIAAVDVSSMLNRPKAPEESLRPGESFAIPATRLATHDENKRPSPNGKGRAPAKSQLTARRITTRSQRCRSSADTARPVIIKGSLHP